MEGGDFVKKLSFSGRVFPRDSGKTMKSEVNFEHRSEAYWQVYPNEIGFPVFLVTSLDIFYFFLWSLIADKLPKEEK